MLQPKLNKVEAIEKMKLRLFYETGEIRIFDVSPYATGSWYGELKNDEYFRTVRLLPGGIGIEWKNGQDIAPHELYECSALWDGDFTKVTPEEAKHIEEAEKSGFIYENEIDWDNLSKYSDF